MRGQDKLLEDVSGQPLLARVATSAQESQAQEVVVVLGARAAARREALSDFPCTFAVNDDWDTGMASSIRTGVVALTDQVDAALILLGDMPEVETELIDTLITSFDPAQGKDIIRPVSASGPVGNPILFGKHHFPGLMKLTGDTGAKPLIAANRDRVLDIPVNHDGVLVDLDTPEAWAAWREG